MLPEQVLQEAAAIDAKAAAGQSILPLCGLPLAVKDSIDCLPYPTSAATPALIGERSMTACCTFSEQSCLLICILFLWYVWPMLAGDMACKVFVLAKASSVSLHELDQLAKRPTGSPATGAFPQFEATLVTSYKNANGIILGTQPALTRPVALPFARHNPIAPMLEATDTSAAMYLLHAD